MLFKDQILRDEFWELTPRMRLIVCDADHWAAENGYPLVWTDFVRQDDEQRKLFDAGIAKQKLSVHQFGRGADARASGSQTFNLSFVAEFNKRYIYDPQRTSMKTVLLHKGTGLHFHLQSMT